MEVVAYQIIWRQIYGENLMRTRPTIIALILIITLLALTFAFSVPVRAQQDDAKKSFAVFMNNWEQAACGHLEKMPKIVCSSHFGEVSDERERLVAQSALILLIKLSGDKQGLDAAQNEFDKLAEGFYVSYGRLRDRFGSTFPKEDKKG